MDFSGSMYLIDAHALIYQMFHAIPAMNAPDGRPTNAVFGFTRDLLWLHQEVQPDYLCAAFDLPGPTFRDAIYPEYKQNRPPAPNDLIPQVAFIQDVMRAMNLPVLSVETFEADDVLATVARAGEARGLNVNICTSDKDVRQLLSDHIKVYNLRKREILDRDGLFKIWGVTPEQVVDFQTLVGDSVDNVPGVAGVGEKTAAKLLQQYGTLDNLVAHVDEIKQGKLKENLKAAIAAGDLEKSRSLVRLEVNVPLPIDWDAWKRREWDGPKLLDLMQGFGFRSFANQVRGFSKAPVAAKSSVPDLFSQITDEPSPPPKVDGWKTDYKLVDTPAKWNDFLGLLKEQKRFAFDLETTGLDPMQDAIVGLAFSWKAEEGWYLPLKAPPGDQHLDAADVLNALRPIFEDPATAKVNQNIKFDLLMLRANGMNVAGVAGDSMIAHYLLSPGARSHGLDDLTRDLLGHQNISITELIGKGKNQKTMDQIPAEKVCAYAAEDADAAWRLVERLEADLAREKLTPIYEKLEIPLIEVLVELEFNGIRLDSSFLAGLSVEMDSQLTRIEKEIHEAVDRKFNIASPKQMRQILFEELKLPIQKRTDTTNEPSTDQESLEKLARLDPVQYPQAKVAVAIVEHRQISKLKGTYVDALPALVNPKTGRLHTSFNQTVAETGRLSSSEPNLQNIPIKTAQGQQIRRAFLPHEGWKLLSADYSQIELRLLAHFCKDEMLRQAFLEDHDIHASVAAEIYKTPLSEVTSEQRRRAKTVNFGVIYGMSAYGLAEALTISRHEAEAFIDMYFARYPKVQQYQDRLLATCRQNGYVATILGRRRPFDPKSIRERTNYHGRNQVERQAINMEIQGSAADLLKQAMLNVHRRLKTEKFEAKMLLTVHDELVLEAPPEELTNVAQLVREEMVGAMQLEVPLKVDVAAGDNWLETEEI